MGGPRRLGFSAEHPTRWSTASRVIASYTRRSGSSWSLLGPTFCLSSLMQEDVVEVFVDGVKVDLKDWVLLAEPGDVYLD